MWSWILRGISQWTRSSPYPNFFSQNLKSIVFQVPKAYSISDTNLKRLWWEKFAWHSKLVLKRKCRMVWFSVAQIVTSWLSEMVTVGALATRWGLSVSWFGAPGGQTFAWHHHRLAFSSSGCCNDMPSASREWIRRVVISPLLLRETKMKSSVMGCQCSPTLFSSGFIHTKGVKR